MAIITRRITNLKEYQFTILCPGENNNQNANLIIPASVVDLDLLTLTTEDNLWTLYPQLLSLQRVGAIAVTGTIDTASFDYSGSLSVPVFEVISNESITTPGFYWWSSVIPNVVVTLPNASTVPGQIFYFNGLQTPNNFTEYPIPTSGSQPQLICTGPDGNLWFCESVGNNIGKITPSGVITEYPVPTAGAGPYGICSGPDGNLWFAENAGNNIGKCTTSGVITEYPNGGRPYGICLGPDGNLWFTEVDGNNITKFFPTINSISSIISVSHQTLDGIDIMLSPKQIKGIVYNIISDGSNWHTI